jgi:ubiquitin-conjugating enzyme E2 variant
LKVVCGPDYPQKPPEITFLNKINIPSVNQTNGRVEKLPVLKDWKPTTTIENILIALKN